MRYAAGLGLLAVILSIGPGVIAQEDKESPSGAEKASPEAKPSEGRPTAAEKQKIERPGRRFGGDESLPADMGDMPFEEPEGPLDYQNATPATPAGTSTLEYLAAIGTLAVAFAVVTAAAVMRIRRVQSADATFKLIALTLIVVAGLSLLRSSLAPQLMAPMMVILGTALGFIFGKSMGSTVPEAVAAETHPVVPPSSV